MAIVLNTEAGNTSSVNNEMLFVAYEATKANDPVTYPDYSYVCDVYVASTLVERLIVRPDPTYNRGIFDVSKALQPYCSYGFSGASTKVDYTVRLAYQLKFGEQYDGTLYTNLLVDSSDRYAFESYAKRPFTSSAVIANGPASNMPSTVNWHRSQNWQLMSLFSNVSGITDVLLKHYTSAGTLLNTTTYASSDFTANTIRQLNVGKLAADIPTADYATVTGGGMNQRIDYLCDGKYTPYTLAWLNPYGGYDSQSFGMVSKKTIEMERKEYQSLNFRINASGEVSYQANNVFYGGKKGYYTHVKVKMALSSHLLTENEYTWLADLFISPEVYIYDTVSLKFIPVTIAATNYEYRNYKNSRLTQIQLDVEFADPYNSQHL